MTSKLFIRVLLCSTFIAGSGTILQSCIFDPGARTLFASEEPTANKQPTAKKRTPPVKRVAARSNEPAFVRSDNGSAGNSSSGGMGGSSGGMGGGSGGDTGGSDPGGSDPGWSDRRLKTDVRRLGTSPAGIPIYAFRYIWGGPHFVGTMAQDLLLIRPDAVIQGASDYYRVDYDKLDIRMISIAEGISLASAEAGATGAALAIDAATRQPLIKLQVSVSRNIVQLAA
ncbi:tail fiber domain-containing protein [Rhizobium leguminosarum]|uniref:tail fiber domain-containing protein n=1 Tax=Rhizobium leguminosarum TaxID=384 RepID=UPI00197E7015|nr:tail fiber domain-containing protein [Rhizobium leguminosarum]